MLPTIFPYYVTVLDFRYLIQLTIIYTVRKILNRFVKNRIENNCSIKINMLGAWLWLVEILIIMLFSTLVELHHTIMLNFTEHNPRSEMFSSWLEGISPLFISNCY